MLSAAGWAAGRYRASPPLTTLPRVRVDALLPVVARGVLSASASLASMRSPGGLLQEWWWSAPGNPHPAVARAGGLIGLSSLTAELPEARVPALACGRFYDGGAGLVPGTVGLRPSTRRAPRKPDAQGPPAVGTAAVKKLAISQAVPGRVRVPMRRAGSVGSDRYAEGWRETPAGRVQAGLSPALSLALGLTIGSGWLVLC